jgi:Rrf2 family nitric oxide-sensitive transcriptional repressor
LAQAGLVRSQPGPGGGYSLAVDPDTVTILAVINAVGELERIRHCPLGLPSHTTLCPLHRELDKVYADTERAFSRVTIGELLRSTSPIVPLCDLQKK